MTLLFKMPRDIGREQIRASTDAELFARLIEIHARAARSYPPHSYTAAMLDELSGIESERHCRSKRITKGEGA